jgi:CO/xanthine dehydrogenase Mo-binding subunit
MTAATGMHARGAIGQRVPRTDGRAKVTGAFAYSSDLRADGMLHGATVRSPHPHARIERIDTGAACALSGVRAVLLAEHVPGDRLVGSVLADQPVLASDRVRYHGEPVALVAADSPQTAAHGAALVAVQYAPEPALTTVDAALADGAPALHPGGNELRSVRIVHGEPRIDGPVVVRGSYEVDTQDQAFLGPESGLAIPDGRGGIELHIATQWLHVDRDQVAAGLGLDPEQVRLVLAGVGGAFGAREDLSVQLHACLLALRTGRPVRMAYGRAESFLGHVHRHPARMDYEHVAGEDGALIAVRARLWLDGGAYASSSTAVVANATTLAAGPYAVPNALLQGTVAYTNNPPNGAMRGFGAVQVAFAYESQMDRLAAAVGLDPIELRRRNELRSGATLPFGQAIRGPAPVSRLLDELAARPLPEPASRDRRAWPGGAFDATRGEGVVRGVGYAAGFKNIAFSEGFDDPATARVRVAARPDGKLYAEVHTAAAEVGQGVLGVQEQVARSELGIDDVRVLGADTAISTAGSASASRLTWMIAGAVREACRAVAALVGDRTLAEALADGPLEAERTFRHRPTHPMDPQTGQGEPHVAFAFAAHRAVVDVDVETGLARVVELACAQDVGRAVNPLALEGQLEGAGVQGLGLALMERLVVDEGVVLTRSLGEYRIPTIVDAPALPTVILELGDPDAPYGVKGVGEIPSISATPAVVAALRAATGADLVRVPVRPEELVVDKDASRNGFP